MQPRRDITIHTARAIGVTFAVIVLQWLMVTAYGWSASSTAPRDVPVAMAGPVPAVNVLTGEISRAEPGAFRFVTVTDAAAARRDITGRLTYGAIIVPPAGGAPQVLTATAASPAIARVLTGIAGQLSRTASPVHDLVPISPNDPDGSASAFALLPMVITSIMAAVLLTMVIPSALLRLAALVAFGVAGGAVTGLVLHTWLGVAVGSYFIVAAVLGLFALAVSASVAGLAAMAGRLGGSRWTIAGIASGAAIFMVVGNPFSGAGSAPEMVPGAWGTFGQWLPPGAASTLLRAVEYFDGSRSGGSWAVLAIWAFAGLALTGVSTLAAARRAVIPGQLITRFT